MNKRCMSLLSLAIALLLPDGVRADDTVCPDEKCPKGSVCRVVADHPICVCESSEELVPLSRAGDHPDLCGMGEEQAPVDQETGPPAEPKIPSAADRKALTRAAPGTPSPVREPGSTGTDAEVAAASKVMGVSQGELRIKYSSFLASDEAQRRGAFLEHLHGKLETKRNVGIGVLTGGAIIVAGTLIYLFTAEDCSEIGGSDPDEEYDNQSECERDRLDATVLGAALGAPGIAVGVVLTVTARRSMRRLERAQKELDTPKGLGVVRLGPMLGRSGDLRGLSLSVSF